MRLHHRLMCAVLALMIFCCTAAQAAGIEYKMSDPVLYADDEPIFILQDLSLSAGLRDDGGSGMAWLDILAKDDTAFRSAVGLDDMGIFAAIGGIPSAYGLSGSALALLTGSADANEFYSIFTPDKIAADTQALINALIAPLETGAPADMTVSLSTGETVISGSAVSGTIDISAISKATSGLPLFSGTITTLQVLGKSLPDIGQWSINGSYGFMGEGETRSAVYRINAACTDRAYDIELIIDRSAMPVSAVCSITGDGTDMCITLKSQPDAYFTIVSKGSIPGAWHEAELQVNSLGDIQFGGGYYRPDANETSSATVICQDSEFYFAVSRDINGQETALYLTSDTERIDENTREGIATLGAYDAQGRVELCADLTITSGDGTGDGRVVDADYSTEILTLTEDSWTDLENSLVNVINGAMYVLSLHVPGFTYNAIDSLDVSGLIPGEAE